MQTKKQAPQMKFKLQASDVDGIWSRTIVSPIHYRKDCNDWEYILAFAEIEDIARLMSVGDRMYCKSNRDEPRSLGILTRIK